MKEKIVYIDDEEDSRFIFGDVLQEEIYNNEYDVEAIEPKKTIDEMIACINNIPNVVSIIVDERLKVACSVKYSGTELANSIRDIDHKIPVYILTSYSAGVEPTLGSVEYVIDKTEIEGDHQNNLAQRMRRHINTYNDIKSERAKRLDVLLKKSIDGELTPDELEELNELNLLRIKPILLEETAESERLKKQLDGQEALLAKLQKELENLK